MSSKLPPLEDKDFDGEKYVTELKNKKCPHKKVILSGNTIYCKDCGVEWQGPNIGALWQAMNEKNKTTN